MARAERTAAGGAWAAGGSVRGRAYRVGTDVPRSTKRHRIAAAGRPRPGDRVRDPRGVPAARRAGAGTRGRPHDMRHRSRRGPVERREAPRAGTSSSGRARSPWRASAAGSRPRLSRSRPTATSKDSASHPPRAEIRPPALPCSSARSGPAGSRARSAALDCLRSPAALLADEHDPRLAARADRREMGAVLADPRSIVDQHEEQVVEHKVRPLLS